MLIFKNIFDISFLKHEKLFNDNNYECHNQIRQLEQLFNINEIKKYY